MYNIVEWNLERQKYVRRILIIGMKEKSMETKYEHFCMTGL